MKVKSGSMDDVYSMIIFSIRLHFAHHHAIYFLQCYSGILRRSLNAFQGSRCTTCLLYLYNMQM
jgi:hypothetical protein